MVIYFRFEVFAKFEHNRTKLFWCVVIAWIYNFIQSEQINWLFNFVDEFFAGFKHHLVECVVDSWVLNFFDKCIVIKAILAHLNFLVILRILCILTLWIYSFLRSILLTIRFVLIAYLSLRRKTTIKNFGRSILASRRDILSG